MIADMKVEQKPISEENLLYFWAYVTVPIYLKPYNTETHSNEIWVLLHLMISKHTL